MSFAEYTAHGWRLTPIAPKGYEYAPGLVSTGKGPLSKGWNLPQRTPQIPPGWGAGLCHAESGTCAIDIDNLDTASAWLAVRSISLTALLAAPTAVKISSGRVGRAKLLYRLVAPLASVKTAPFQDLSRKSGKLETYTALDFRCATKEGLTLQDVLPPTTHPDTGRPYEWAYGDPLCGSWRNLPELPAELRAVWESQLTATVDHGPAAPVGADFAEIRALLAQHDPNADYSEWLRVGMAVHHETRGARDGLLLWNEWSAQATGPDKYKGIGDLEPHWRSFSANSANAVTLGSLRAEAVATVEEFGLVPVGTEAAAPGAGIIPDLRPDTIIRELLGERVVYITTQSKWYFIPGRAPIANLDEHANVGMDDRGLNILFEPHMPFVTRESKDGKSKTERPVPSQVLRTAKNKMIVNSIGFHPGEPRVYSDSGQRMLNSYHERQPVELLRPKTHELDIVNYLFGRITEETMRVWLMKFYGHMLQRPGVKIKSGPLLYSAQTGTGKGTLMKEVPMALFGGEWVVPMTGSILSSRFNSLLADHWVVHLEEMHAGETKAERREVGDKLKAWFTERVVPVERKGLDPYKMPNRFQMTAASNHTEAAQVDNYDRRLAIGAVKEEPIPPKETAEIYGFLLGDRAPGVLREIFRNQVDITGFNPDGRAPDTKAKRTVIQAGLGAWESHLIEAMVAEEGPFARDIFTLKQVFEFFGGRGPATLNALKGMLRAAPFDCQPLPNGTTTRFWAWRNVRHWGRASDGSRRRHIEIGEWPLGTNREIPPAILAMSADGDLDDTPPAVQDHSDLLGV